MATVLFPCDVRLQSSRGTTAVLNFKLCLGIVLIILNEINVTKIDLLRKGPYLFQNYRLYMMLSIFWTERKFVVDDLDSIFFPGFPAIQNDLAKVGDVTKELFLSKK